MQDGSKYVTNDDSVLGAIEGFNVGLDLGLDNASMLGLDERFDAGSAHGVIVSSRDGPNDGSLDASEVGILK